MAKAAASALTSAHGQLYVAAVGQPIATLAKLQRLLNFGTVYTAGSVVRPAHTNHTLTTRNCLQRRNACFTFRDHKKTFHYSGLMSTKVSTLIFTNTTRSKDYFLKNISSPQVVRKTQVRSYCWSLDSYSGMELGEVVNRIETVASPSLAASWDNVGLLVEPSPPHLVNVLMLTNDLTEDVMTEALEKQVDMILSYHPPIFNALKRFRQNTWKEKLVIQCIENRVALYSPHTAFDCFQGGTSDWLLAPFEGEVSILEPGTSSSLPTPGGYSAQATIPADLMLGSLGSLRDIPGVIITDQRESTGNNGRTYVISLNCTESACAEVSKVLSACPEVYRTLQFTKLHKPRLANVGGGRLVQLTMPVCLASAVSMVKRHLGLTHVRLATAPGVSLDTQIHSVAGVPGSGASLLREVKADLYLTGEMSHHEVLDATHRGSNIILADHSNTERGFLTPLRERLSQLLEGRVVVILSDQDADPLRVV